MKILNSLIIISLLLSAVKPSLLEAAEDKFHIAIIPTDTHYEQQWYLKKIKAQEAWEKQNDASNVIIAIIDTGVQIDHPDLRDSIWKNTDEIKGNMIDDDKNGFIDDSNGWDFVNNTNNPSPKLKNNDFTFEGAIHGTIIAGIIGAAGNNASGITGIAWRSQLMPLKALDDKGEGDIRDIIKAIDYAIKNNADIINLSFVGHSYNNGLEAAIERAYKAGVIVVAAAGNEASEGQGINLNKTPMYPVCLDGGNKNMIVGVASTDALDQKSYFSGYGSKCVDITAPGESIFSTTVYSPKNISKNFQFGKQFDGYWSGTSMAVPMVSAAAALVKSANPWFDREDIIKNLKESADNIRWLNPKYADNLGFGRLNLNSSIFEAKKAYNKIGADIVIYQNEKNNLRLSYLNKSGKETKQTIIPDETAAVAIDINASNFKKISIYALQKDNKTLNIYDDSGKKIKSIKLANNKAVSQIKVIDIDSDGKEEYITAPARGQKPVVRIFDQSGKLKKEINAYPANVLTGLNIAIGDANGDGQNEIITGTKQGAGPLVRIFNNKGSLIGHFFSHSKNSRDGVTVDLIDFGGGFRGKNQKIVTIAQDKGLKIKLFDNKAQFIASFPVIKTSSAKLSTEDMDLDGEEEIIIAYLKDDKQKISIFKKNAIEINTFFLDKSSKDKDNLIDFNTLIKISK